MPQMINQNEFEEKVLQADKPVLVDFYADWCGPCKMMIPVLDQLSAKTGLPAPKPLASLRGKEVRFDQVVEKENMVDAVRGILV